MATKWIQESSGMYFPTPEFRTLSHPGKGVFNLEEVINLGGKRLGLRKISDRFEFPFEVYDLGTEEFKKKVIDTWNSDYFIRGGQNLGILLTGTKGCGKSIDAKLLSNQLDLPIIIVGRFIQGMVEFISELEFEAVILLDEAEKCWPEDDPEASQSLLRTMDGAVNKARKLYILTTNSLKINENLLGRPGRIRYIQEYKKISPIAINKYLEDNLINKEARDVILDNIESLEVSTIDTLKALVDEANIHGTISKCSGLNLTLKTVRYSIYYKLIEEDEDINKFEKMRDFIDKSWNKKISFSSWAYKEFDNSLDPSYSGANYYGGPADIESYLECKFDLKKNIHCSVRGKDLNVGTEIEGCLSSTTTIKITKERDSSGWFEGEIYLRSTLVKVKMIVEKE